MELVCPAGSMPALKAAVDNGANAVYLGFRDGTNARNFPGLNFDLDEARRAVHYAHERGARVFLAINTYPRPSQWQKWCRAVDQAATLGIDALILADPGLMDYTVQTYPDLRLHLSVQGSATSHEAIDFYVRHFGVRRVVLPRVLSLTQVQNVMKRVNTEVEVFGFGSLCVMVEGRCTLSSYVTGESPNSNGVCSPAKHVKWEESASGRRSRLNGVLIDTYAPDEPAGYPTICKGRFAVQGCTNAAGAGRAGRAGAAEVGGKVYYAMEEPTSLNVLDILPELYRAGVAAIKVEGRQRSPAYVAQVTRTLREAIDACISDPETFVPEVEWVKQLDNVAEGRCHTLGAYSRPWQ
ncbi:MAG: U32 family peptidase [Sulfuricaulis sp.]|uniref:peptidase U32 family protein n=1 Tax=Sulfuricaulis sp. TaxID=2003553 RepID=UPI0025ECD7B4|nr:peptidase U32 family protein [Sulfuricaulis sp.]MCR4346708.1 U32 family peptidase [Sulfuricaulis sp.]